MAIKFITDLGVGRKVENFLKSTGYDVTSVRDINPQMTDFSILELAVSERRIVVTMDKDFGELVYNSGYKHHGILLLRLENMNGKEKTEIVQFIIQKYSVELRNKFCVYQKGKFRIRHK